MEAAAWAVTLMLSILAVLVVAAWTDNAWTDKKDDGEENDPWEDGGMHNE